MLKWLRKLKTPSRRILDIVKRDFAETGSVAPRHEVREWSADKYGMGATPFAYYYSNHWMGHLFVQYFCNVCDGELVAGPSGGGTNSVCPHCKINYGCLPLSLER